MPLASITDQMLLVPQTMLQEPSGTSCTIRMFLQLAPRQSGSGWNLESRFSRQGPNIVNRGGYLEIGQLAADRPRIKLRRLHACDILCLHVGQD